AEHRAAGPGRRPCRGGGCGGSAAGPARPPLGRGASDRRSGHEHRRVRGRHRGRLRVRGGALPGGHRRLDRHRADQPDRDRSCDVGL
ncbi:MAG: FIG043778: hypothetical protein, partial [uncultured Friedmanniella sp.]